MFGGSMVSAFGQGPTGCSKADTKPDTRVDTFPLIEIKGAPCTLCAHFGYQWQCTQYVHAF